MKKLARQHDVLHTVKSCLATVRLSFSFRVALPAFATFNQLHCHLSATYLVAYVSQSATIHQYWATFSRKPIGIQQSFAWSSETLVASAKFAGEHLLWLQTGLLSALSSFFLRVWFLYSGPLHRTRRTKAVLKNTNHAQKALRTLAKRQLELVHC